MGKFFSNNHVHPSQGGTQEASDSISDYLFRMQFLSYQGWKGKVRRPWSTFQPNTDLDESTASTTNFPWVRNILSLLASHLLASCFITASYLCESLLLHCIQHRLGRKTVKGKAFLSSQELHKFHGPQITSEIVFRSNTTYSNLLPCSFFFLVAAFTVKKFCIWQWNQTCLKGKEHHIIINWKLISWKEVTRGKEMLKDIEI